MLLIIIKNLVLVACIYVAYQLSKRFFDDNQKLLRIIVTFILVVVFFGIANGLLSVFTSGVNVDKQLQAEEMYVALKLKHPQDYQLIVDKVTAEAKLNDLNQNDINSLAEQHLMIVALELVSEASDEARYDFTKAYAKTISMMRSKGGTLCYDMMHNQGVVTSEQMSSVDDAFKYSGMPEAILKIINDNKVGKAVASQKDMDKMEEQIFLQLFRKHGQDVELLINPQKATSEEDKRKVCEIVIDLYTSMNDPKNEIKMAVLRKTMENMSSSSINELKNRIGSNPVASAAKQPEPEMAASAFD